MVAGDSKAGKGKNAFLYVCIGEICAGDNYLGVCVNNPSLEARMGYGLAFDYDLLFIVDSAYSCSVALTKMEKEKGECTILLSILVGV